jgi:heme exporter protein CcmD
MITGSEDVLFVILAYVGVAVVTLGLIGLTWWQSRQAHRRIAALEKQGIRRRSTAGRSATAE